MNEEEIIYLTSATEFNSSYKLLLHYYTTNPLCKSVACFLIGDSDLNVVAVLCVLLRNLTR